MSIEELLFVVFAFFCGSIPFAVWLGKYAMQKDIRDYGDGNPGAFNVLRAGGFMWGGLALMLEVSKAAFPVGLANYVFNIDGIALVLIAVAPSFGHAFSPFLRFKGGKAIATIGGVWIGLSLWQIPLPSMLILIFWYVSLTSSGWAVMFTMVGMLVVLLLISAPATWLAVWVIQMGLLIYKHRAELVHRPVFKRILFKSLELNSDSADPLHNGGSDRH